ncbi:restriction endonuclease subunit S [Enterococcus faecium]|uniref:Restriction endonuclease subunit S n=1 Tax=Enterococcus faecium TaxID=1352 RepID=A0A2G0E8C1_ENTFC|nr:restriction endonuclease subunit S [Enterococcus faecium]PHL20743.1 restriction endonuclease subunit S [Enterococcus faecium]
MSKKSPQLRFEGFTDDWEERKLGEIFNYEQPTKYIVKSTEYDDNFNTPVLTAGKSFLLGYTDEISGIKNATVENPVVIFDDFTTGSHYVDFPFKIKSSAMKLLSLNDNSDNFYFMFNTLKNIKYVPQSHERHWISKFSSFEIYKPSQEEQQKIGAFFKQLDETIALHQRKLGLLKEQKKGYLQKMFPKNGAKVPELRFAGFADDWEDRKLSSIAERVTRKNKNNESTLPLTISAQDGLVDQNDYFNKQVASRDVTGYFLVKNGEFAYNKSYSNGYPWGAIKRLDKYEMGVLSTLYIVFKPTAINSQFLVSYYETTRWYREVSKNAAEGARNHGLLNISPNDFFNTLLTIPKSAEEQQQIGSFFKQLDDTIALHQRKLDLLKEQKKGYLQKMFAK